MGTRVGSVEKVGEKECEVGLGLRMQKTTKGNTNINNDKSFSGNKIMMIHAHNNNDGTVFCEEEEEQQQQHHFGGPFYSNSNSMSDMYDVGSLLFPNSESLMSYNSSVMGCGGAVRDSSNIPFTASQRQELETQTMIYKYMMASLPVPPHLLIPITTSPTATSNFTTRTLELGLSSHNSSESEPWRCKRTDGKKWRCSRNVVPDQKYCERHSHKSRPRSRKHVEQNSQLTTAAAAAAKANSIPYSKPSHNFSDHREKQPPHPHPPFSAASHDQPRGLDWFVKGHEVASSNQDWHHQMAAAAPPPPQGFDEYNHQPSQQQSFFLDQNNHHQTRHFIDAWSESEREHMAELGSHNGKSVTFSSLTLSMNHRSGEEDGEDNSQMGFGIGNNDLMRSQWLMHNNNNSAISWNDDNGSRSPPGGPLAEALCLGMAPSSTRESSSRSS